MGFESLFPSQVSEFVFSPKCGASQSDATGVSARIRQGFLKSKRSERDARRGFEPIFLRKSLLASRFSSEAIIKAWLLSKMNCLENNYNQLSVLRLGQKNVTALLSWLVPKQQLHPNGRTTGFNQSLESATSLGPSGVR